jgi:SAM-dependent methyltransferase
LHSYDHPVIVASVELPRRRGRYGIDAPFVPLIMGGVGVLLLAAAFVIGFRLHSRLWAIVSLLAGLFMLLSVASYLYTTLAGKFLVWGELLRGLNLSGHERVLDLGCGRGMVLLMVAQMLPRGKAVGIDLWQTADQSGNAMGQTKRNAAVEGVSDRVEVRSGDLTQLPFAAGSFDIVLSSLAIHNIPSPEGRRMAIDEAVRVLKPGGRLVIVDFQGLRDYARRLRHNGMAEIEQRGLGWRFWYGGPWTASRMITAKRPS